MLQRCSGSWCAHAALVALWGWSAEAAQGSSIYIDYSAGVTNAATTLQHVYAPSLFGWLGMNTAGAESRAIDEGGSGLNAWILNDAVAALPNPSYVTSFGPAEASAATNDGFRFEVFGRYITDYGGGPSMGISMYLNQRAYHLMLDLNAAGDLQATLHGRSGGPTVLTSGGTGTAGYHRFALESSGGASLTAQFDGQPIGAPWTGVAVTQPHENIVLWGNANQALGGRGSMAFNQALFELGPLVEVPGDFDGDADADGNDLLVWQRMLGSRTQLDADANGNGVVDAADLSAWRSAASAQAAGGTAALAATVPEPAAAALFAACAGMIFAHRRRRKKAR